MSRKPTPTEYLALDAGWHEEMLDALHTYAAEMKQARDAEVWREEQRANKTG